MQKKRQQLRKDMLEQLKYNTSLNDWEKGFIADISKKDTYSPKQRERLLIIANKLKMNYMDKVLLKLLIELIK